MQNEVKVRINFSSREIEVSGSNEAVQEWMERLEPYILRFTNGTGGSAQSGEHGEVERPPSSRGAIPGVFGEYYHEFPSSLSAVDKMLIAAYFAQIHSEDQAFSTNEAAELLKGQGDPAGNPSQCVKQNLEKKHVFVVSQGKYRVSRKGVEHIESLRMRE